MSTRINTNYWGQAIELYADNNVRTGASDLENADFTDYPPFVRNDYNYTGEDIQYINAGDLYYSQLIDDPVIELNESIDTSIAYCACKNMDIPINQIIGFSIGAGASSTATLDVTDDSYWVESKQEPLPIMFLSRVGLAAVMSRGVSASQYTFNPEYTTANGYAYCQESWCPHASNTNPQGQEGSPDTNTGRGRSNKNLFLQFWRDFGIRSVFLQIDVKYFDGTYNATLGIPNNVTTTSLYAYSQQTAEWRAQHPLLCAWANVIRRTNIDGTYGTTGGGGDMTPDLTHNLVSRFQYGSIAPNTPILQPMAMYDTNDLSANGMPIFGGIRAYRSYNATMGANANGGVSQYIALLVGGSNGIMTRKQGISTSARSCWVELQGTDENIENIRKWCAAYGLFFTDGRQSDSGYNALYAAGNDSTRWTNEKMCLGVVDEEGMTDGTYTRGTGNEDANNFLWKTASESRYDPDRPPPSPENEYSEQTDFNSIGNLASLTKRYVLDAAGVESLGTALWDITADLIDNGGTPDYSELNEKILDQFLTNNPIDCIVSLQRFPMSIPSVGTDTVKLGKTDTGISCKSMEKTAFYYLFSGKTINPKFGDSFLDYEPYTKMELYVPFCGTIQLNPADILGRKLNVQLAVDFTTGTATGFVMSDDLVIETVNGNIAIDIPFNGIQSATVASQLNNAIANRANAQKQSQIATLGNVSIGGVLRAIKDPTQLVFSAQQADINEQRAEYELTHQNAPIHIIGSASAVGGWCIDLKCRLLIYYPTGDVIRTAKPPEWDNTQLARYGKNTGFACCMEKSIGSMGSGLVLGINPDLSGMVTDSAAANPATAAELEMIRSAIAEGVIVPFLE